MPRLLFVVGVSAISSLVGCTLQSSGSYDPATERSLSSAGGGAEPASGSQPPADSAPTPEGMDRPDAMLPSEVVADASAVDAATDAATDVATDAATQEAVVDAAPDAGADDSAADAAAMGCVQQGRYAIRFDTAVLWETKILLGFVPVIEAGEGDLSMTVLVDFVRDANELHGEVWPCDATQPEFQATDIIGAEKYAMYFEPTIWESEALPRTPVRVELGCDQQGCVLASDLFQVPLGITPPGDPTAPWPEDREALEYVDHDGDGLAGVTLSSRGPDDPGGFSFLPVGVGGDEARIESMQLGLRMTARLSGVLDSCQEFSGTAPTYTMETHVSDCTLVGQEGGSCARDQALRIDRNLPVWMSREVTFAAKKVDDAATCAQARDALPAAP